MAVLIPDGKWLVSLIKIIFRLVQYATGYHPVPVVPPSADRASLYITQMSNGCGLRGRPSYYNPGDNRLISNCFCAYVRTFFKGVVSGSSPKLIQLLKCSWIWAFGGKGVVNSPNKVSFHNNRFDNIDHWWPCFLNITRAGHTWNLLVFVHYLNKAAP